MNDIIKYRIPDFLSYQDLVNLSLVDHETHDILKDILTHKKMEVIENMNKIYPKRIIDMVGRNNLLKGRHVEWDLNWLGYTDYIDRVRFEDLSDTFSYGVDNYRRSFIFVRMRRVKNNKNFVIVIFQRYTDRGTYVAIDPMNGAYDVVGGHVAIGENYEKILTDLINGEYPDYVLV